MKLRYVLFLLVAVCTPLFLAVVITGNAVPPAKTGIESRLSAATNSIQSRLDADAANRGQHLLRLAAHPGINRPLIEAAGKRAPSAELAGQLRSAYIELIGRDVPALFAVATAQGTQVVVSEGEPVELPVDDVPLVTSALGGQTAPGGTFAMFDGTLFRMYAMPVGVGAAAIVVGDRVGNATANRLRDHAKIDHISFVLNKEIVTVSSLPVEERELVLPAAQNTGTSVDVGHLGTGLSLPASLNAIVPVFSLVDPYFPLLAPSALTRSLGLEMSGDVAMVVTMSTRSALGWLGRLQFLSIVASVALLIFGLLWMGFVFRPVKRQARSIESQLSRLQVDRTTRLGVKGFAGPFVGLAKQVDALAAHIETKTVPVEPPTKEPVEVTRPQKPLDLPLQSAPAGEAFDAPESTGSDFPFGAALAQTGTDPEPSAVSGQELSSPEPVPATTAAPAAVVAAAEPLSAFEAALTPAPAPFKAPPPEPMVARFSEQVVPDNIVESSGASPAAPVPLPAPRPRTEPPTSSEPAKSDPFSAFGPPPEADINDRTREARIPEELLAQSRALDEELVDPAQDLNDDEAHFQEVFKQYIEVRQSTGEGIGGLTAEKFTAQLRKNREKLVERFDCKTIRFSAYVKAGKAAIKAAPVR